MAEKLKTLMVAKSVHRLASSHAFTTERTLRDIVESAIKLYVPPLPPVKKERGK